MGTSASSMRRQSAINRDRLDALDTIGNDSVYHFFLAKSMWGWAIALATMVLQIWMLFVFVGAAESSVSNNDSDLVFTWKCLRDRIDCVDKADVDGQGWAVFAIIMATHLSKDVINGTKMIVLAIRVGHGNRTRMRFLLGGLFLSTVMLFTLFVSILYNQAIATTNTEVIINAVVILFITDTDEYLYKILTLINQDWVKSLTISPGPVFSPEFRNEFHRIEGDYDELREKVRMLEERLSVREPSTAPQHGLRGASSNATIRDTSSEENGDIYGEPSTNATGRVQNRRDSARRGRGGRWQNGRWHGRGHEC